jgi:hypothetical protein
MFAGEPQLLSQIHNQYRVLDAQAEAFAYSATRAADDIFSQMFSDYRDELNKQKALRGLPQS